MVKAQPVESVPTALSIDDALRSSAPLARLRERVDGSNRRFLAIRELLPDTLAASVRPGPLDERGWTLLATTTATAAKLRQLLPLIEGRLAERGYGTDGGVRVRVACAGEPTSAA